MNFEMVNFKVNSFIECAEELLRADETERALQLLDNLPAYYRDHVPKEIQDLKNEIIQKIATPRSYSDAPYETGVIDLEKGNEMDASLRGILIERDVKYLNDLNLTPHIIDYGPGEFWLPICLKKKNLKFTYEPIALNLKALEIVRPHIKEHLIKGDGPKMFIACEIIEHLWSEQDIKTEMLHHCGLADIVHISTPKYTYETNCEDWRAHNPIGHLRAYTPTEFVLTVSRMFKEYAPFHYDHKVQHMRLTRLDTIKELTKKIAWPL